jgi:hypothetical protein
MGTALPRGHRQPGLADAGAGHPFRLLRDHPGRGPKRVGFCWSGMLVAWHGLAACSCSGHSAAPSDTIPGVRSVRGKGVSIFPRGSAHGIPVAVVLAGVHGASTGEGYRCSRRRTRR